MPDFYSQIDPENPGAGLQAGLIDLADKLLANDKISTPAQNQELARLRAFVAINLKDF